MVAGTTPATFSNAETTVYPFNVTDPSLEVQESEDEAKAWAQIRFVYGVPY